MKQEWKTKQKWIWSARVSLVWFPILAEQKHYAVKNFMRPYYNNIGIMNLAAVTLEKHDADDMKTV